MSINVQAFVESLNIMLIGLVGIFAVMAVLYGVIFLLGKCSKKKD